MEINRNIKTASDIPGWEFASKEMIDANRIDIEPSNEEIVRQLNGELYDIGEEEMSFSWTTNGFCEIITFEDFVLYNSENNDRQYTEDGKYEPMLPFIKRQYNNLVDRMATIKFDQNDL